MPLRVSAISYLNTAPLMWEFERDPTLAVRFDIRYTLPSRCAELLAKAEADIGIIPVAAYTTIPGLVILPDVAIASKHAVRSILLVSNKPLDDIRNVALDTSSRSSAALVQVLFAKHWRQQVNFEHADPDLGQMLARHDAALLIGDPALQADRARYLTWDLAEEWRAFTGKPFVFAFWAARRDAASEDELAETAAVFSHSRNLGLAHLGDIADSWSPRLQLPSEVLRGYLSRNIHYYLDDENVAGMRLFFEYAAELGVLPRAPELNLVRLSRNSLVTNRV